MKHFNPLVFFLCLIILPFFLQAQTFDIYFADTRTGDVFQVTDIPDGDKYNVTFSNNSHKIAYDLVRYVDPYWLQDVYIFDLDNGEHYPLLGADGGNDASWSPNGQNIVFDRNPYGDPNIYYVPAAGGDRTMIAEFGGDAEWSNNSKAIVFNDFFTGGISTIKLNGSDRTVVTHFGYGPSWSPNGKHIAFVHYFDNRSEIFTVRVNENGEPLGDPLRITYSDEFVYNSPPSWSNNGDKLVFHSNRMTGDYDIWTYELSSGEYERLAGFPYSGDYDPCYSKNGQYVGFSHFTEPLLPRTADDIAFTLSQNYPNPFTTATTIDITLEKNCMVQLMVYNHLGQLTDILLNNNLGKGNHQIHWNPSDRNITIPGGVYYLKLLTPDQIITKQMIYTPR